MLKHNNHRRYYYFYYTTDRQSRIIEVMIMQYYAVNIHSQLIDVLNFPVKITILKHYGLYHLLFFVFSCLLTYI